MKIQGHGWGQSSKTQCESNILSTHIPLVPCQSTLPFLRYSIFKIWPSKSKVKIIARSQSRYNTLWTHIPFIPYRSTLRFLGYSYFKIWCWKFKIKVMGEVKVESHKMGPTFSLLTSLSFHVNRASHSWVKTFSKFYLENPGSRSWVRSQFKGHCASNILSTHIPFVPCQSALPSPIPEI